MALERPHVGRKQAETDRATSVAVVDVVDQRRRSLAPVVVDREQIRLLMLSMAGGEPFLAADWRPHWGKHYDQAVWSAKPEGKIMCLRVRGAVTRIRTKTCQVVLIASAMQ
jgi:hypothetical protein